MEKNFWLCAVFLGVNPMDFANKPEEVREVIIKGKEYEEILIINKDNELLASITDKNIIVEGECEVTLVPNEKSKNIENKINEVIVDICDWIREQLKDHGKCAYEPNVEGMVGVLAELVSASTGKV